MHMYVSLFLGSSAWPDHWVTLGIKGPFGRDDTQGSFIRPTRTLYYIWHKHLWVWLPILVVPLLTLCGWWSPVFGGWKFCFYSLSPQSHLPFTEEGEKEERNRLCKVKEGVWGKVMLEQKHSEAATGLITGHFLKNLWGASYSLLVIAISIGIRGVGCQREKGNCNELI